MKPGWKTGKKENWKQERKENKTENKKDKKTRKTGKQERRVCSRGPVINGYRKSVIAKFGVQNIHEAFTMAMIHKLL